MGGAGGLFGAFFRRVGSGGFNVQSAMLLLAHAVGRLSYLQRCLAPDALEQVASDWDALMLRAVAVVLDLADHELGGANVVATLRRPRALGGFGLSSAVFVSPFAFVASVAASAAKPGGHPLADDELYATSLRHQSLDSILTSATIFSLAHKDLHTTASSFLAHCHSHPDKAAHLQSQLCIEATCIVRGVH